MGYIDAGKTEGATCELGGGRFGDQGYFIQPTVFSNTKPDMKIVKEEIFGPVVVLIKFSSDEEVIKMANDTEYGLASAVFSRDISRALVTANKIHAGTVWVNCKPAPSNERPLADSLMFRLQPVAQQRTFRWIQAVRYRTRIGRIRFGQLHRGQVDPCQLDRCCSHLEAVQRAQARQRLSAGILT